MHGERANKSRNAITYLKKNIETIRRERFAILGEIFNMSIVVHFERCQNLPNCIKKMEKT